MQVITLANNQMVIKSDTEYTFFSYDQKIAEYSENTGVIEVGSLWDYSKTTLKYFKKFIDDYTNMDYLSKGQFEKLLSNDNQDYIVKAEY